MKKIGLLVLLLFMLSCSNRTNVRVNNLDCTVIDTVYVAINGFGDVLDYTVIIKIDSSYYGAIQETDGSISLISENLNNIKSK